jgi:hypothetical protein
MEPQKSLFSSALRTGLIIGVVSIVVFIIMYVADFKPVGIMKPILMMLISLAINIAILVVLFKKYRTEAGGFISFRDAFLYCLIALVAGALVSTIFTLLFIQFIEPGYYKNIMDAQKTWMENYLSGKGLSDEQMTQALDKIDEQAATMGSITSTLKNLLGSVIVSGIIALIVGAIMKKNPDVFDNTSGGVI